VLVGRGDGTNRSHRFGLREPRACPLDAAWRCGTVTVPLDRAEPEGETLEIAFYVLPYSHLPTVP
jgi:hypothetical protein